jgi:hypothetical protein
MGKILKLQLLLVGEMVPFGWYEIKMVHDAHKIKKDTGESKHI